MPLPSREQVFAIMFAFMMVTSMMPSGAVASGGESVEELDGGDEQLDAQFDVEGNESTTNTTDDDSSTNTTDDDSSTNTTDDDSSTNTTDDDSSTN
ncbi:hypothetical protein, partial [Halorubrum sp. Atlit-26R]|uniref:hypothetical protein n=1 Tax=Halorubrum sp. Atlit-26R TaxID=2282128 RepID=UPI000F25E961